MVEEISQPIPDVDVDDDDDDDDDNDKVLHEHLYPQFIVKPLSKTRLRPGQAAAARRSSKHPAYQQMLEELR